MRTAPLLAAAGYPVAPRHRFVGRQPIVTATSRVFGHEYLYRSGPLHQAIPIDRWSAKAQDRATQRVLEAAFGTAEPPRPGADRLAFVNFTRSFLVSELPVPAMAGRLVVEVVESVRVDAAVLAGVRRLREDGFRIAIDDFVGLEGQRALLPLADFVKIDLRDLDRRGPTLLDLASSHGAVLVAERVETPAALARAVDAGFSLFQGHHLGCPELLEWSAAEGALRRAVTRQLAGGSPASGWL